MLKKKTIEPTLLSEIAGAHQRKSSGSRAPACINQIRHFDCIIQTQIWAQSLVRGERRSAHLPSESQPLDVFHSFIAHRTNEQVKPGREKTKRSHLNCIPWYKCCSGHRKIVLDSVIMIF